MVRSVLSMYVYRYKTEIKPDKTAAAGFASISKLQPEVLQYEYKLNDKCMMYGLPVLYV